MPIHITEHGNINFSGNWKIGNSIYDISAVKSILDAGPAKCRAGADETEWLTGPVTFIAGNGCSLVQDPSNNTITIQAGNAGSDYLAAPPGADTLELKNNILTYLVEDPAAELTLDPSGLTLANQIFHLRIKTGNTPVALRGFDEAMQLQQGEHRFIVSYIQAPPAGSAQLIPFCHHAELNQKRIWKDEIHYWPLIDDFADLVGNLALYPDCTEYRFDGEKVTVTSRGYGICARQPIIQPRLNQSFSFCGFIKSSNATEWNTNRIGEGLFESSARITSQLKGIAFGIDGYTATVNSDTHFLDNYQDRTYDSMQFFAVVQDADTGVIRLHGPTGAQASATTIPAWDFSEINRNFGILTYCSANHLRFFDRALTDEECAELANF